MTELVSFVFFSTNTATIWIFGGVAHGNKYSSYVELLSVEFIIWEYYLLWSVFKLFLEIILRVYVTVSLWYYNNV